MLSKQDKKRIQESLQTLAANHAAAVTQIEETIGILQQALELDESSQPKWNQLPVADTATFCVIWHNRSCFLGNTLLFWLFHRLVRSANRYVSHVDLMDEVWKGDREISTIRGVAKRLRDRLTEAEMADLARAIDGTVAGYYGLILV